MPLAKVNLSSRVVVVTGASSGIGRACALRLDRKGHRVFAGVRRAQDAEGLKAEASPRLVPILLDVTDATSVTVAADQVTRATDPGGLAGLVNNAGIAVAGPLEFISLDELRRQFEVNVIGQVAVTQAFLPLLRRAHGRIINIGSVSGRVASPLAGPYAASKFALEALTDALRRELAPWNLHVALIESGNVATPIWAKTAAWATTMMSALPDHARSLYGDALTGAIRFAQKSRSGDLPPEAVARAVELALTVPRPKTRYLVGREAQIVVRLARLLPDRWLDVLLFGRPTSRAGARNSMRA